MKILVSANREKLASKMDLNALCQLKALQSFAEISWHGPGWSGYQGERVDEAESRFTPDLVYFADLHYVDLRGVEQVRAPKAILYEDPWDDVPERLDALRRGQFQLLVTKYYAGTSIYLEKCPWLELVLHPHGFNDTLFHERSLTKVWDLLLCGRDEPDASYNVRKRLKRIGRLLKERGFAVLDHPHSGYWDIGEPRLDSGQPTLAELAAQSRVSIAGTAGPGAHVAKLWELPATGSLCFTDLTPSEPDYQNLATHVWMCDPRQTDAEILKDMEKAISVAEHLAPRCTRRVHRYATLAHRAQTLVETFELAVGRRHRANRP